MKLGNLKPEADTREGSAFLSGCETCRVREKVEETELGALCVQLLRHLQIKGRVFEQRDPCQAPAVCGFAVKGRVTNAVTSLRQPGCLGF